MFGSYFHVVTTQNCIFYLYYALIVPTQLVVIFGNKPILQVPIKFRLFRRLESHVTIMLFVISILVIVVITAFVVDFHIVVKTAAALGI